MKENLKPALCAILAATTVSAYAQDIPEIKDDAGNRVSFVKTSQDTTVYNILEKDRSKNVNEIPVPHFAIHTANNKFVMTIGAQINPIIGADLGSDLYKQEGAGINFVPSQIAIPSVSGRKSDFFINALNASIDLQVVGFGGTKDQITGYIKLATNGNDKTIELNKAYVTWRGLTAGLKHSLFQDESVVPPTIDPQGPNGLVANTVNEIGYVSPSFKGFSFGIGLDMPTYYSASGHYWGTDYKTWAGRNIEGEAVCDPEAYSFQAPDIPLYAEWGADPMNRIRLSGILRPMIYRDLLHDHRCTTLGWGLSHSGNINPVKPLIFYLQATYGKGIGAYIQDLAGMPISFVPKNDHPGHMTPTPMMGWSAAMTYNINDKWQINVMGSQARIWHVSDYAEHEATDGEINNYKYGYYGAANVFYNLSSYFQLGLEYDYGYRKSWDMGSAHDNRIQFQVMFSL